MKLQAEIGVIARPDIELQKYGFVRHKLKTKFGLVDRLFLGEVGGYKVAVIYGRFDEKRTTSSQINFEKTQAAFNELGVKKIYGAFVTGSIQDKHKIGDIFIINDFVGIGNYNKSLFRESGFKNVDMFKPFCPELSESLIRAANNLKVPYKTGIYVCFHGWPRIETAAELTFYKKMGWDIVGQTLDPEATLARESGCCYAAVGVTIDDAVTRDKFMAGDAAARIKIQNAIPEGRKIINQIIFKTIEAGEELKGCNCGHKFHSEKSQFRHLPGYLLGE